MSSTKKQRKMKEEEEYEPGSWECTVCTFRNRYEAFKCEICDTRKGTSTRKPRLNPSVVQQQTLVQNLAVQQSLGDRVKKQRNSDSRSRYSPESTVSMATTSRAVAFVNPTQQQTFNKIDAKILKRKMIPFRDALVVRSTSKKRIITVNNIPFTITEFKHRISPRGRKKISTSSVQSNTYVAS